MPSLPSCYNRPAFVETVKSEEFDVEYEFRQSRDCPHWKPGGNAFVRKHGDGAKGQRFEWSECDGCNWKV